MISGYCQRCDHILSECTCPTDAYGQPLIVAGCYVETKRFGEAVCIYVENGWAYIRYEANRCSDGKLLWVLNSEPIDSCRYLRPPDEKSLKVLTLQGPYGED